MKCDLGSVFVLSNKQNKLTKWKGKGNRAFMSVFLIEQIIMR